MSRSRNSRLIPIIFVIIVAVIAIIALVSIARAIFFPSNVQHQSTAQVDTSREALLSTDEYRSVSMTVRGPIVANETFYSYKISISPSQRVLTTYRGYTSDVIDQVSLSNSPSAYEQFVYALDKANLSKGEQLDDIADDVRGVCATGRVIEFDILNNGSSVKHLWTSSCDGSRGSLDASTSQLNDLFVKQIPNASKTISETGLSSSNPLQLRL